MLNPWLLKHSWRFCAQSLTCLGISTGASPASAPPPLVLQDVGDRGGAPRHLAPLEAHVRLTSRRPDVQVCFTGSPPSGPKARVRAGADLDSFTVGHVEPPTSSTSRSCALRGRPPPQGAS